MSEARKDSVNLRAVVWVGAIIVLVLALVGLAAGWLWKAQWPPGLRDEPNTRLDFRVAPPLLDSAPQPGRTAYDTEKRRLLDSWEWVDRRAGVARIPLEQAMQILAQQPAASAHAHENSDRRQP